jgi:translocator protein
MTFLPASFRPFWVDADSPVDTARRPYRALLFFLALCGCAAFYASLYAPSGDGEWGWYPRLSKPDWLPSPSLTGPVSTLFYFVLAFAIWRIWRTGAFRTVPITLAGFLCLLLLQSIWSTLFYGLQSPALGLVDLAALLLLATVLWLIYRQMDVLAAWLWGAYILWLSFLLAVNAAIWWVNG